jgi:ribulose-5-phosphate 4-epimerase/fuculose-1-phosphate aldolase
MGQHDQYRQQVLDCALRLVQRGFLSGTGGNISVRVEGEDRLAITPTSREYTGLNVGDICIVDFERNMIEGTSAPSVETSMHIAVYKSRLDVGAIIHTHQVYASVYALTVREIPALFDEQVANLGNRVAVVPYGLSGSEELTANIAAAVAGNCNAYILQNHGALVLGTDISKAARNVELLEKAAKVFYLASLTGKQVTTLSPEIEAALFDLLTSDQRREARRRRKLAKEKAGGEPAAVQ